MKVNDYPMLDMKVINDAQKKYGLSDEETHIMFIEPALKEAKENATKLGVSIEYLNYRNQLLNYSNTDMNLKLDNDDQVYIALFDIPLDSGVVGFKTQSLALVFGLNTNLYHGSGKVVTGLEERAEVMKSMQSVLVSCHQVIPYLKRTDDFTFYNSNNVRVYLKTKKGVYLREVKESGDKIDKFLLSMMNFVLKSISDSGGISN